MIIKDMNMDNVRVNKNNLFRAEFEQEWKIFTDYFLDLIQKTKDYFDSETYLSVSKSLKEMRDGLLHRVDTISCPELLYERMAVKLSLINTSHQKKNGGLH